MIDIKKRGKLSKKKETIKPIKETTKPIKEIVNSIEMTEEVPELTATLSFVALAHLSNGNIKQIQISDEKKKEIFQILIRKNN